MTYLGDNNIDNQANAAEKMMEKTTCTGETHRWNFKKCVKTLWINTSSWMDWSCKVAVAQAKDQRSGIWMQASRLHSLTSLRPRSSPAPFAMILMVPLLCTKILLSKSVLQKQPTMFQKLKHVGKTKTNDQEKDQGEGNKSMTPKRQMISNKFKSRNTATSMPNLQS